MKEANKGRRKVKRKKKYVWDKRHKATTNQATVFQN